MYLEHSQQYKARIELANFLKDRFSCEETLTVNFDPVGFVKCHVYGKIIELVFDPPSEITDEYIFELIEDTLTEIGTNFVRVTLRQFIGNAARTLVASATGGAIGARAGIPGLLLGLIGGAVVEKALFDWRDLCKCEYNDSGGLIITDLVVEK